MPVAQDHLAEIRKALLPVLRRRGFRVRSKREWVRGDDASGWVVISWWGDKWNTKQTAEATLMAAVWPPGTREHRCELYGVDVEAWAGDGPVGPVGPSDVEAGANTFVVRATMPPGELDVVVSRAQAYAEQLVDWADTMLDPRESAPLMRDDHAVAALLVEHPDDPVIDDLLDRLTASFQRDPRPISLGAIITRWRAERGLPEAPMPPWSRYASRRTHDDGRIPSPRDALLAGIGTAVEFSYADGSSRRPEPDDLPDAAALARWREEVRDSPLPDGVLPTLPEWLPYASWLEGPEPEPAPARRWWQRR